MTKPKTEAEKKSAAERRAAQARPRELGQFKTERELDEFDFDVLRILPEVGAKKGRYMHDTLTVPQIKRALDPTLTSEFITQRMKTLRSRGLVSGMQVTGAKGSLGYQRTEAGKKLVASGRLTAVPNDEEAQG